MPGRPCCALPAGKGKSAPHTAGWRESGTKTIDIGPVGMDPHIARFDKLAPKNGAFAKLAIPNKAYEMLAAKTLYTIMAPAGTDGSFANPVITGPAGLLVSIAECAPGDGPLLHAHT